MFFHRSNVNLTPRAQALLATVNTIQQHLATASITAADLKAAQFTFEAFDTRCGQQPVADQLFERINTAANGMMSDFGVNYAALSHASSVDKGTIDSILPSDKYIPGQQMLREAIAMTAESYETLKMRRQMRTSEAAYKAIMAQQSSGGYIPEGAASAFERRYDFPMDASNGNPEERAKYTKEAYVDAKNTDFAAMTVAYNMANIKQTPFVKALYNSIVQPIEQIGLSVELPIDFIRQVVRSHNANGAPQTWTRYKLPDLYTQPDKLLKLNDTKLIPVYRKSPGKPETDTSAHFVVDDTVAPGLQHTVEQNGSQIPTSFLKVNRVGLPLEIDYLGLCQTDDQLARGTFDDTDQIAPSIKLKTLLYKITGTVAGVATTEYIVRDVSDYQGATFQPQFFNGNTQEMNLDFHVDEIYMGNGDTTTENTTSKILAQLGTYKVALGTTLGMRVKLDEGKLFGINHNPTSLYIARVLDNSTPAVVLDPSSAGYAQVATVLVTPAVSTTPTIQLVGFELDGYRTNYNNRSIGSILDRQVYKETLVTRVHASIAARFPVANASAAIDDVQVSAQNLASLLSLVEAYTEMQAVNALFDRLPAVQELQNRREHRVNRRGRFTIGAELIEPTAIDLGVRSLSTMVQSTSSTNVLGDMRAAFNNLVRSIVVQMWVKSRFYVINKLYNGEKAPVNVKVLVHAQTGAWVGDLGDLRTLTLNDTQFNVEVVCTSNEKMCDTINDTFNHVFVTMSGGTDNGTFNPTANGHILQTPEIIARYVRSDNGGISQEMRVQPVFALYENNPLVGHVSIPGFNSFFNARNLFGVGTVAVSG